MIQECWLCKFVCIPLGFPCAELSSVGQSFRHICFADCVLGTLALSGNFADGALVQLFQVSQFAEFCFY